MSGFSRDQLSAIRAAVAHLIDGYALFDSDDHLLVWNKTYESLNTKVCDLLVEGVTFETLIHALVERGQIPEAIGREQKWIEERIRLRRSGGEDVERQVQVSDGRWFLVRERVTPDDGVVGIWCDITERIHTEEALRASDQQFRTTFDQDVFGMALRAVGTRESRWLDVNQKFCDILGYTRDEILRLTSIDITIAEEQQEAIDYNDKLLSGEINSYSREKRYVHKDGHIIWANIWLSVVQDRDGKPNKIISVVQDISERKRVEEALRVSEERYALAVSGTANGLWDWNIQTGEDYQSPRWKEILGYEEHELENRHETFTDALHPEDHDRVMEAARAHLEERVPYDLEYRLRCKNGSYVWIHAKGQAIWDEFGTPLRMAGSNSDITERKAAEETIRAAMKEAENANRTKTEFLANMSHELRTPLNAIIGFSEIIKDETFGPVGSVQYRDYAGDINESGHHLLALINDILDLSKVESGTDELHEENIDISQIAKSILKLVVGLARKGNVELELDVSDDIPLLYADERKVKQILLNLLSNAIKFTPEGGKVTLKIWSRAESGYVFQVTDTGIGIAFEDIPKAMSPFQQIDSGLARKHEGTGLGLPLTKSLVEMHGGYLDLQSKVGVGTTVTVRFPAERIVELLRDSESMDTTAKKAG